MSSLDQVSNHFRRKPGDSLPPGLLGQTCLAPTLRILVPGENPESFRERTDGDIWSVSGQEVVELWPCGKCYENSMPIVTGMVSGVDLLGVRQEQKCR